MTTVCVSPNGSDKNSGTYMNPLATVGVALERVRGTSTPKIVNVLGGVHRLAAPIEIGKADKGVTIRAVGSEIAVFSGSRQVAGQWKAQQDGSWQLRNVGGIVGQVWLGGERLAPAQLPQVGFYTADRTLSQTAITCRDVQATDRSADAVVRPYSWFEEVLPCDVVPGRVTLRTPCREALARDGEPGVFRLRNVRAGLVPGTWYHDRRTADLYVRLPQGATRADLATVEVANGPVTLLNCEGSDVALSGLQFGRTNVRQLRLDQGGDYTSHAIRVLPSANSFVLDRCYVGYCGAGGVALFSTRNCLIRDCHFKNIGESVVTVSVDEPRKLSDGRWSSDNNVIEGCTSRYNGEACGSSAAFHLASTYGAIVKQCVVEDAPHCGVRVNGTGGQANTTTATGAVVIENNIFCRTLQDCSDGGAVYFWGDTNAESVVRGNLIDSVGAPRTYHDAITANVGIYVDDWGGNILVEQNAIRDCDWGFNFHACHDVRVLNNVLVGVRKYAWNQQWEPYGMNIHNVMRANLFYGSRVIHTAWGIQNVDGALVAERNVFLNEQL